jgi:putative hydrolase of the HAD superfamily
MSEGRGLEGLVLDVDDTLYMEHTYVASGFRAAGDCLADSHGIDGLAEAALALFEEGVRGDIFDRALTELGVRPAKTLITELLNRYRTHQPDIELLPDVRSLMDAVALRRLPIAVITDGPAESQRAKIAALGIEPACDLIIVTSDHVGVLPKPDFSAYELVQKHWGLEPAALAYIGDNPSKDFIAPHRLGWRTVRVRRPGGLHEVVPSGHDVDTEVSALFDTALILGVGDS